MTIRPTELGIERICEAVEYVRVITQAVLFDELLSREGVLRLMLVFAQTCSIDELHKRRVFRCLRGIRQALHELPFCWCIVSELSTQPDLGAADLRRESSFRR